MKIGASKAALCAVAVLLGASGAHASVIATYQGTVKSGIDSLGLFGAPGTDLTGDSFTVRYTISDGTTGAIKSFDPPHSSEISGSLSASPVRGNVSINRRTISVLGRENSGAIVSVNSLYSYVGHAILDKSNSGSSTVYTSLVDVFYSYVPGAIPWDYHTPYSYTFQPGDILNGNFQINAFDNRTGNLVSQYLIDLPPSSVTVSVTDSVPELSTWAMMLIGFAAVGWRLRRQTSEVARAG